MYISYLEDELLMILLYCLYNYCIYLYRSPGIYLIPINYFQPGVYISPFCVFYIGIYLLWSAEPLHLCKPSHLYHPAFIQINTVLMTVLMTILKFQKSQGLYHMTSDW